MSSDGEDLRKRNGKDGAEGRKPIGWVEGALSTRNDKDRIVVERRRKTTLVMFSGGIDSTYTLVKLLRETDDEILAHHIHLVNQEGRHAVEARACKEIVRFCRKAYRDFGFSESVIDHRGFRFFGYDMVTVGFEAGIVAHSYVMAKGRAPDRWTIGYCAEEETVEGRWQHVEACLAANCFPHDPPRYFGLPLVSKREEMDYLGPELLELVWTCRTPRRDDKTFTECGVCKTCTLMAEIRSAAPAVPEARE